MNRVSMVERDHLPESQRRFHDALKAIRRSPISGPFIVLLNSSPDLAARFAQLGHYFHARGQADEAILPLRVRTFMAMIGSRALDAVYEWSAWVGWAIESGVPQRTVDAIRERRPLDALTAQDTLVLDFCSQLAGGTHHVSDATFNAAREHFGVQALVELVGTLGYFAMIAFPLNAFQMEMSAAQIARRKPFEALRYDPQRTDVMQDVPAGPPKFPRANKHSAPRLPHVKEHADLPPLHQHFFDRIVRIRGCVDTPYQVLLNSPDMAERIAYVADYFLYQSPLDPAIKALVWLITAREFDSAYAWKTALELAHKAGIESAITEAIYQHTQPTSAARDQEIVYACCCQLLRGNHHIDDAAYNAALERFGLSSVVQIAATLGYVAMMSIITNAFELDIAEDSPGIVL